MKMRIMGKPQRAASSLADVRLLVLELVRGRDPEVPLQAAKILHVQVIAGIPADRLDHGRLLLVDDLLSLYRDEVVLHLVEGLHPRGDPVLELDSVQAILRT